MSGVSGPWTGTRAPLPSPRWRPGSATSDPGTHPQLRTPPGREPSTQRAGAAQQGLRTGLDAAPASAWPSPSRRRCLKVLLPPPAAQCDGLGAVPLSRARAPGQVGSGPLGRDRSQRPRAYEDFWAAPCLAKPGLGPSAFPSPQWADIPRTTRPAGLLASPPGRCPDEGKRGMRTGPSKAEAPAGLSYTKTPHPCPLSPRPHISRSCRGEVPGFLPTSDTAFLLCLLPLTRFPRWARALQVLVHPGTDAGLKLLEIKAMSSQGHIHLRLLPE